jgi:redox-regulated HSP33 family molecular chaperone
MDTDMSKTKKKIGRKYLVVVIDPKLKRRFKSAVAANGRKIQDVMTEFVQSYLGETAES